MSKHSTQKRKKKFERSPGKTMILQPRDYEILKILYQFRFADSQQIKMMIGQRTQKIQVRLRNMFHAGYLDRPLIQTRTEGFGYNAPMVYALSNRGAEALITKLYGLDEIPERLGFNRNNRAYKSEDKFRHDYLITKLLAPFYHVERIFPDEFRFITPLEIANRRLTPAPKPSEPFGWQIQRGKRNFNCYPDSGFGLSITDKQTGKQNDYFYFPEVDLGTMPLKRSNLYQSSIYKKYLNYLESYKNKLFSQNFGFKKVRVLFVTNSRERMNNMIALNRKENKIAPGLFKFSYFNLCVNMDHPEDIMKKAWYNTRGQNCDIVN